MRYEITFVDHGGRIFSTSQLEAPSHEDAIALARRIHRSGFGAAFQIWDGEVLVHTEALGSKPPPAPTASRTQILRVLRPRHAG